MIPKIRILIPCLFLSTVSWAARLNGGPSGDITGVTAGGGLTGGGTSGSVTISADSSSTTLQGNTFNGTNQLVKTNASGELPALSATNLTSIPAANVTGILNISSGTITNFTANSTTSSFVGASTASIRVGSIDYLDARGGGVTAVLGADNNATTRTNSTQKNARVVSPHFTTAQSSVAVLSVINTSAGNTLRIGGGESSFYAATSVNIYTATNNAVTSGTLALSISTHGAVTQPVQPSFLVINSTGPQNITGDGSTYTMQWPTEVRDRGGNFSTDTFTAPVDGTYHLSTTIDFQGLLVSHNTRQVCIVTSNRSYCSIVAHLLAEDDLSIVVTADADMEAGDTAQVRVIVTASTKVVDLIADAAYNRFSGFLAN